MPTSSHSLHPSYKSRRRSEAIGLSTNSVAKFFFSEKKVGEEFDQPEIVQKSQQPADTVTSLRQGRKKQDVLTDFGAGDTVDSSSTGRTITNRPRSSSFSVKGKAENANNETNRRGSYPRSDGNKAVLDSNANQSRRGSVGVALAKQKPNRVPEKPTTPDSLQAENDSQNPINNSNVLLSPVRMQQLSNKKRRRDSMLRETAALPNIIEEQ